MADASQLAGHAVRSKRGHHFGPWHWTADGKRTLCGQPVDTRGPTAQCVGTKDDMRWPRRRLTSPCQTCAERLAGLTR